MAFVAPLGELDAEAAETAMTTTIDGRRVRESSEDVAKGSKAAEHPHTAASHAVAARAIGPRQDHIELPAP
jgi:hypothetical protein